MLSQDAKRQLDAGIKKYTDELRGKAFAEEMAERTTRRQTVFAFFQNKELLRKTTFEALTAAIKELWFLRGWKNRDWYIENTLKINKDNYTSLITSLEAFLFGTGDIKQRITSFAEKTHGLGLAGMSEMLYLNDPTKYPLFNAKPNNLLKGLGVDLREILPRGKKRDDAELYAAFTSTYQEILAYVKSKAPEVDSFDKLDALFWKTDFYEEVAPTGEANTTTEEGKLIVVKMGAEKDFDTVTKIWQKQKVASFGFDFIKGYSPEKYGGYNYPKLREVGLEAGASEGQIKKIASYIGIFASANIGDWVLAYHKGKMYGYGQVSKKYHTLPEVSGWEHAVGVDWKWLDTPMELKESFPTLYRSVIINSSVNTVKKKSALNQFWTLIGVKESQETESDSDETPGHLTIEEVAADCFVEPGFLQDLITSFLEPDGKRQIILDGAPGTGKTFVAQKLAEYLCNKSDRQRGEWKLVPCHGGMTFEQMFQGLLPDKQGNLCIQKGLFVEFCEKAESNPDAWFVVILDEINRANIPQVFGPLLYLLEYRGDAEINLPFDKESLSLPENLLIIGTMNSEDRSTGLVDFAFRRRFLHFQFPPDSVLLASWLKAKYPSQLNPGINHEEVLRVFDTLNERLRNHDRGFQVGHSYFMTNYPLTESGLERLWDTEILPLLHEKFYHERDVVEREFSLSALRRHTESSTEDLLRKRA